MEYLRRFLLVVVSLALMGLVLYVIIISSARPSLQGEGAITQTPGAEPPAVESEPPTVESPAGSVEARPSTVRPETPAPAARSVPDSVRWRTLPRPRQSVLPREIPPVPYGNPNPIFISAARRILPAVVSVNVRRKSSGLPGDLFHRFFRHREQDNPDQEEPAPGNDDEEDEEYAPPGSGSGIIVGENGYILTNYHVVEDAREIRIVLYDKREFDARIIGGDPTTDLALLKIEASDLPAAFMGNSDSLQIGEWVLAVGNPLNFTSTVTAGIVSALGRDISIIDNQYGVENFIQTDAVINPGNSGGALVNLKGEVVGINTAIATRTGLYQGYGFAIPSNLARKVVDDILQYGRVRRGLLGISIGPVDAKVARSLGLATPTGALVQSVQPGYPAEKVGIRQGDVILSVDGEPVSSPNDLQLKIARHHPGDMVSLEVWRDGQKISLQATLGEAPTASAALPTPRTVQRHYPLLGLEVRPVNEAEKAGYQIASGLFVEQVHANSPSDRAGITRGEVIVSAEDAVVSTPEDLEKILQGLQPGDVVKLRIKRLIGANNILDRLVFVEVPPEPSN